MRHTIRSFTTPTSRLAAEIASLLLTSAGIIHILACILFYMTRGIPGNYQDVSHYEYYGDYSNGTVRAHSILPPPTLAFTRKPNPNPDASPVSQQQLRQVTSP